MTSLAARATRPVVAILSALSIAAAFPCLAAAPPQAAGVLKGEVLEVKNVESYTYLRLKTADGETWAAVPTTAVKPGAQVTIARSMTMAHFESKTLKKTFDTIVFGQIADPNAPASPPASPSVSPSASPSAATAPAPAAAPQATAPSAKPIKVDKASGPEARTVAEVVAGKAKLKDKTVLVRGQVVKVNSGIMGKNWLHLRDGTGSAADGSNDILVTTKDVAAIGDIVSAKGLVRTDVNLGAGYAYAVLIEDAAVRK